MWGVKSISLLARHFRGKRHERQQAAKRLYRQRCLILIAYSRLFNTIPCQK